MALRNITTENTLVATLAAGALVQWFEPHSGLQVSKKQNVSSLLTRKNLLLWGASVTERKCARHQTASWARISNAVCGGQCHLIHFTILMKFC